MFIKGLVRSLVSHKLILSDLVELQMVVKLIEQVCFFVFKYIYKFPEYLFNILNLGVIMIGFSSIINK